MRNLYLKKTEVLFDDIYLFEDFVCNDFFIDEKYNAMHLLDKAGEPIEDDYLLPDFRFKEINTG